MKPLPPLPDALKPLMKLLEKEQPRVVVVVGTGVSWGATHAPQASWIGLLKHGIDHLAATKVYTQERREILKDHLDAAFSPFNLELALRHADLIEQNLKTPNEQAFADWLEAAFRDFKADSLNSGALEALRNLQQSGALLLTTNYDSLLSDATGLPPVTWEQRDDFLAVTNRQKDGILHIHGHWQRPASVILGKSSYDRVVADQYFQDALKSLWLQWSWVYIGCGNGMDDPNLGPLREWGKNWGQGQMQDYFLAQDTVADALEKSPSKPTNLVCVGYADHSMLADRLNALTPAARCFPFVPIDEEFSEFRSTNSIASIQFPSRQEYLDGEVPALRADQEVQKRLTTFGWAFVLDVASVGKTTLALRMATSFDQRAHPAYYLDFAIIDAENDGPEASAAMKRLSRPNTLLILDNIHHQPELGRQLWDQWRNQPRDSRLLLIATRTQRPVITAPAQDLAFFSQHVTNPAVELHPQPDDLGRILESTVRRMGITDPEAFVPPPTILQRWYEDFGSTLGAFCLAALNRLQEFRRGNWELPPEAAADWVRDKWLKKLSNNENENVLCLAVFGAQELELQVSDDALPHPGKTEQLMQLGLVARSEHGLFAQYRRFSLREPGWGQLILAAQTDAIEEDRVLLDAAARHPLTAVVLSGRLWQASRFALFNTLWAHLASTPDQVAKLATDLPLSYFIRLVVMAKNSEQVLLSSRCWEALEGDLQRFAERAWETELGYIASLVELAKQHNRDADLLWRAIERQPERIAKRAWETDLGHLAWFMKMAKQDGRDAASLWAEVERRPEMIAERAWETPLENVASFLETAKRQGRDVVPLWEAMESQPDRLAGRASETPLNGVAAFLETAKRQGRDVIPLWQAIERQPKKFAERAWETPLNGVAAFLETAKRQGRNVVPLWEAMESQPNRLAVRAWETQLGDVASFFETAKQQKRNVDPLWEAIERQPDRLAERAWETPLNGVAAFLETAKIQDRDVCTLWNALECEPQRLADLASDISLGNLASFFKVAKQHERNIESLVEILQSKPERLSATGKQADLLELVGFCHHAPDGLVKTVLADIQVEDLDAIQDSKSLLNATWIASRCGSVGREDLEMAIIEKLLRRANPRDFPQEGMGLANIAWMLMHTPATLGAHVPAFLNKLCTKRWLELQFNRSTVGPLATGLRLLALNQTPATVRRFFNPALGFRLSKEFFQFRNAVSDQQCQILEFFGCAMLCGLRGNADWFRNVSLTELGRLPVDTLAHKADALKVDAWQFQLWLGLRATAFTLRKPLQVPSSVVEETLRLWRINLAESEDAGALIERRVNQDMVKWLERCSQNGQGFLVPAPWVTLT